MAHLSLKINLSVFGDYCVFFPEWFSKKHTLGFPFPNVSIINYEKLRYFFNNTFASLHHSLATLSIIFYVKRLLIMTFTLTLMFFVQLIDLSLFTPCFDTNALPAARVACGEFPTQYFECQCFSLFSWWQNMIIVFFSGQLPYLIEGSTKLTQSSAITRYFARKHGLGDEHPNLPTILRCFNSFLHIPSRSVLIHWTFSSSLYSPFFLQWLV